MGSEHSTEWLKRSQYLDVLSSHVLPPATLSWPLFLQCKFFCTGYAAFCSWLCPLAPSKDMYGGHAPFQPYMEAKHVHQYLCQACYEGFWQVPWLSSLTLTRSKAQFGKSRKKGKQRKADREQRVLEELRHKPSSTLTPLPPRNIQEASKRSDINTLGGLVPVTTYVYSEPASSAKTKTQVWEIFLLPWRTLPVR